MRIIRDVEAYTQDPKESVKDVVKINGASYAVAHVGTTMKQEEYKKLLTTAKKQAPLDNNGKKVVLSHAYRTINKEHIDNEFVKKYNGKVFVTYVHLDDVPKGKSLVRAPLNFVDRIYDMDAKVSLGMNKDKRAAKWSEFDNFPKGSAYPKFCTRYFHNQVRPRSGLCAKRVADSDKGAMKKKQKKIHSKETDPADAGEPPERSSNTIITLYSKHVGERAKVMADSTNEDGLCVPLDVFDQPSKEGHFVVCAENIPDNVRWVVDRSVAQPVSEPVTPPNEATLPEKNVAEDSTKSYVDMLVRRELATASDAIIQRITANMRDMCDSRMQELKADGNREAEHETIVRAINGLRKEIRNVFNHFTKSNARKKYRNV